MADFNFDSLDQLGPVIKSVVKSGKKDAFIDQLSVHITKQESEIERICNFHYQEFVQSVDQLLKVRSETVNLKNQIIGLAGEFQSSGGRILEKKKELLDQRRIFQNIETAIEHLQSCLHVLDLVNRANIQIDTHKFYAALRTLDELQNKYMRNVIQYDFAKYLVECIPALKENLQDAVMRELREWFVKVRENSRKVGKLAMEQVHIREQRWKMKSTQGALSPKVAGKSSGNINASVELVMNEENEANILDNEQVKVDFRPLYQSLHIFDVLGKLPELISHYEENRRLQANLALNATINLTNADVNQFETLLQDIVGFFIIESVVLNTTQNFRSRAGLDLLWDMAVQKISTVITDSLATADTSDLYLTIKLLVVVFVQTLEGYGYSVNKLVDLLMNLFERYCDLMKVQCSQKVFEIIEEDDYSPMTVANAQEYENVLKAFKFKEDKKNMLKGYPRSLPFSKMFPICCDTIKTFVRNFYRFSDGFSQQLGEMDDILKKVLDNLLIHYVNSALVSQVESSSNLSQILQILSNFEYFELSCAEFERMLAESRKSSKTGRIVLQATKTFRDSRKATEKRLFELLNSKVNEFIELANYDFMPTTVNKLPSPYLRDIVNFLTTVMYATLENLPREIKSFIYFEAFDHMATSIYNLLLSSSVRKINMNFVENFNIDVTFLERFVIGLNDPNLVDTFLELRQAVNLLKSDNIEEYGNPEIRHKKYSRLRKGNVITLLEKLNNGSSSFLGNKAEKNKRKSYEALIKTLKSDK
ncbi:exocyst complex subunit Sec15-like-domain-containing protein [Paraphysoderma sedebokerense]|nr:exocyst complex subunit Sec15-like-domain-containing protein [Paraphysoderma sedebokerense]